MKSGRVVDAVFCALGKPCSENEICEVRSSMMGVRLADANKRRYFRGIRDNKKRNEHAVWSMDITAVLASG